MCARCPPRRTVPSGVLRCAGRNTLAFLVSDCSTCTVVRGEQDVYVFRLQTLYV